MTIGSEATKEDYSTLTLVAMKERNEARLNSLGHQGVAVQDLDSAYLETLLEVLLGDRLEEAQRVYETRLGEHLDHIESQILRARLGISPSPVPPLL